MPHRILLLLVLLLQPLALQALELGQIRVQSYLNEPLRATIELREATDDALTRARFALASPEVFAAAGITPVPLLEQLEFALDMSATPPHLLVSTAVPVPDPFLSFVLALEHNGNTTHKNYVLLLDPPLYSVVRRMPAGPTPPPITEPVTTAIVAAPSEPVVEQTSVMPAEPSETIVETTATLTAMDTWQQLGPTRAGDTLWKHARVARSPEVTLQQTLVGLHQANPDAFARGNMNLLKDNQVLALPPPEVLAAIPQEAASRLISAHEKAWSDNQTVIAEDASLLAEALALVMPAEPLVVRIGAQESTAIDVPSSQASADTQPPVAAEPVDSSSVLLTEVVAVETETASTIATTVQSAAANEELVVLREERDDLRQRLDRLEEQLSQSQILLDEKDQQLARFEQLVERLESVRSNAVQDTPVNPSLAVETATASDTSQSQVPSSHTQLITAVIAAVILLIVGAMALLYWQSKKHGIKPVTAAVQTPDARSSAVAQSQQTQDKPLEARSGRRRVEDAGFASLDDALDEVEKALQANTPKVQQAADLLKETHDLLQNTIIAPERIVDYVPVRANEIRRDAENTAAADAVKRHEDVANLLPYASVSRDAAAKDEDEQPFAATLDLARAFIEIGDLQAAKDILLQVQEQAQGEDRMAIAALLKTIDQA